MADFDFGQILPRPTNEPYSSSRDFLVMETCYDDYQSEWMSLTDHNQGHPLPGYDSNLMAIEDDYWRCIVNVRIAAEKAAAADQAAARANTLWETIKSWWEGASGFKAVAEAKLAEWTSYFNDTVVAGWNALKQDAQAATQAANDAAANANDTADHPNYVGEDYYVYRWNKATKSYDKTNIMLKGEGFHISKTFLSKEAMDAYTALSPRPEKDLLKENNFFLINTNDVENPDNAKLYVVQEDEHGSLAPAFLVDMSGAIGFTGKTPQITIGTVSTSAAGTQAVASLSPDGTDDEGNPKYRLNFSIPKGDKGDKGDNLDLSSLTDEEKEAFVATILSEMAEVSQDDAAAVFGGYEFNTDDND